MSKVCYNFVCDRDQGTAGCPAAEWCAYYIADPQTTTAQSSTKLMPIWQTTTSTIVEERQNEN